MPTFAISVYLDSRNTIKDKRQNSIIKGIRVFGSEIKLSQFADDTNLFCADVASAEKALKTMNVFGNFSALVLNVEKTKAFWLGKWLNNRAKPLGMKWMNTLTKLLGIYVSYDETADKFGHVDIERINTLWKSTKN